MPKKTITKPQQQTLEKKPPISGKTPSTEKPSTSLGGSENKSSENNAYPSTSSAKKPFRPNTGIKSKTITVFPQRISSYPHKNTTAEKPLNVEENKTATSQHVTTPSNVKKTTQLHSATKNNRVAICTHRLTTPWKKVVRVPSGWNIQDKVKPRILQKRSHKVDLNTPSMKPKISDFNDSVIILVNRGGIQLQDCNDPIKFVHRYLVKHKYVLPQLINLIWADTDIKMCRNALEVLLQFLIESELLTKGTKPLISDCLCSMNNVHLLVNSIYTVDVRFSLYRQYQEDLAYIRIKLLQIIAALCTVEPCRKQVLSVDNTTVQSVARLLNHNHTPEEVNYLFEIVKLFCSKGCNCKLLSNNQFYDALCNFKQTCENRSSILSILGCMCKQKFSIRHMAEHVNIIRLMLDELVTDYETSYLSKRDILNVLYSTVRNDYGLSVISKKENVERLCEYFLQNKFANDTRCQLMLYSILNHSVKRVVLTDVKQNSELYLLDKGMGLSELRLAIDSNDFDSNEFDSNEFDSDDSDDLSMHDNFDSHTQCTLLSTEHSILSASTDMESPLAEMKMYFSELYKHKVESAKFNLYEDVDDPNDAMSVIYQKVGRLSLKNQLAYPDYVILPAIGDCRKANFGYNAFPLEHFGYKLKCACGIITNTFVPRIIYDLDLIRDEISEKPFRPESPRQPLDNINKQIEHLEFDSRFECGNLQRATQINHHEYDLIINPDTTKTSTVQWFYFQICKVLPGIPYWFNIINYSSNKSMYNRGTQPLMFSKKEYNLNGTGWTRSGENIVHYGNRYTDKNYRKQFRTLSFCIQFCHSEDTVYLCSHYPYTYTRLMAILAPLVKYKSNRIYVQLDKLCDSANGLHELPLLTITAKLNSTSLCQIPINMRPIIVITGRVHPGESNSSWIVEGAFKFLLRDTDEDALYAREHFIFKIIPMLNPEGVVVGNTRRSLTGDDLNRCWMTPHQMHCPEVYFAKKMVKYALLEINHPIAAYIDIHGHSQGKGFFIYGCNPKLSWKPEDRTKGDRYEYIKYLPETLASVSEHLCLPNCSYKIHKMKEKTARVVMWREFGIENSYTLECSLTETYKRKTIDTEILCNIGESIITAFGKIGAYTYNLRRAITSLHLDYRNIPKLPEKKEKSKNKN